MAGEDIKINLGLDETFKSITEDLKKAAEYAERIKVALKDAKFEDVSKVSMLVKDAEKLTKSVEKKVDAHRQEQGYLGRLLVAQKELKKQQTYAEDAQALKKVNAELKHVTEQIKQAKGAQDGWGKALGSFQFKFNALGNIAANVVSKITQGIKDFAKESIQAALQIEGVRAAFNRLNDAKLLDQLRTATMGTVSDLKLMQAAVRANNFKLPLNQLATYFQFATKRAMETGEAVDYMVESILLGISRQSIKIIDNLGISAQEIGEEFKQTGDFAQAVGNIIARDLGKSGAAGQALDYNVVKVQSLAASWENIKTSIGGLGTGVIGTVAEKMADFLKYITTDFEKEEAVRWLTELTDSWGDAPIKEQIPVLQKYLSDYQLSFKLASESVAEDKKKLEDAGLFDRREKQDLKDNIARNEAVLRISKAKADVLSTEVQKLTALSGAETKEKGILEKLREQLQLYTDLREASLNPQAIVGYTQDIETVQKKIDDLLRGFTKTEKLERIKSKDEKLEVEDEYIDGVEQRNSQLRKNTQKQADLSVQDTKTTEQEKQKVYSDTFDAISSMMGSWGALVEANKQKELSAAGDNAKEREKIEKEYLRKQQTLAIAEATMNTASGIVGIWKAYSAIPGGQAIAAALSAIYLAKMLTEIATIKKVKFGEGGEIKGKAHSQGGVDVNAEGGEFIVKKSAYRKHRDLIKAINEDKINPNLRIAFNKDIKGDGSAAGNDPYTRKIYEHLRDQVQYWETNEFFYVKRGSVVSKYRKVAV